jgi:hypothetical protein
MPEIVGTYADWDLRQPNFWYVTGRIIDGAPLVRVPVERQAFIHALWDAAVRTHRIAHPTLIPIL